MAIQVAGEGWISDLYDWFGAPQWVQVYDRRVGTPPTLKLPMGAVPSHTQPIRPQPTAAQVPAVGPKPTFTNTTPPPLIPVGLPQLPTGQVGGGSTGESEMAIDWGSIASTVVSGFFDPSAGPQPAGLPSVPYSGLAGPVGAGDPSYNGKAWASAQCKKRRRRRPILTQTDIGILFQISTLPNNANVRTALARSIRR